MRRNTWFEFKQFRIEQQKSAMKVSTDSVLIGAWARVYMAQRILDVGTGTGVIALMMAQRSLATVVAIEIEAEASQEARRNFNQSHWAERLSILTDDFSIFANQESLKFDLIVSNPPFFADSLKSKDKALATARHTDDLSHKQLLVGAKNLLAPNGLLSVILPYSCFSDFKEEARLIGFYLKRRTVVIPKIGKPPKRVLIELSLEACYPELGELAVLEVNGDYTEEYKSLTTEFYPGF
jgi:tRNA1Val (adenine37-N6)-methyltransferase